MLEMDGATENELGKVARRTRRKSVRGGKVAADIWMTGKTVLVTGANTGIGFESALDLAKRGARVLLACRNQERGRKARDRIERESGSSKVVLKIVDLASFESIRTLAADIIAKEARLDVIINNAGVLGSDQSTTADGFEMQFGVNHLGHFLLTNLLTDLLKQSAPSRVVTVSSIAHHRMFGAKIHWDDLNLTNNYGHTRAYAQSKLMNVLFSRELARRMDGTGVTSYCLEPGGVRTDLQRHVSVGKSVTFMDGLLNFLTVCTKRFWKSPEDGAQTSIYCAVAPELRTVTGKFYRDCKEVRESTDGRNDEYARRLWGISEEYTGIKA